eukprot:SAG31_NODE_14_length_37953_cov_109.719660_22_plen_130_part_00
MNFGLLTRNLVQSFIELGGDLQLLSTVEALEQQPDNRWVVAVRKNDLAPTTSLVRARYIFAGAGAGSLKVLQQAGLPEVQGYAAMPVSGKFLVCQVSHCIPLRLQIIRLSIDGLQLTSSRHGLLAPTTH